MPTRTVTLAFLGDSKQLQASMAEAGLTAQKTATTIGDSADRMTSKFAGGFSKIGQSVQNFTGLPVAGIFDKFASKFDEADTKGQKFSQTLKTIGGAAVLGGAVALAAVGGEAIHMADQFDTAQAQLQTAVKNSGHSFSTVSPQINATYASMAKLGFNSTETATSLSQLTTATGNPTKAISVLSIAANLARLKNISLSDASGILTKTLAGSTRGLTSLGLNLDIGSAKLSAAHGATQTLITAQQGLQAVNDKITAGTLKGAAAAAAMKAAEESVSKAEQNLNRDHGAEATILDTLKKKTDGAAAAYGKTLPGQMAIARAEAHNLGTQFGEVLVPIVEKVMGVAAKLMGFLLTHKVVLIAVAAVIGGVLLAATVAWTASLFAAGGALAFVSAPILLVVALIAALAAAAYEIVTHWGAITAFFSKLWGDVKQYFMDAVHFVESLFLNFTPEGLIYSHWSQIVSFFKTILGQVEQAVSRALDAIVGFFTRLPGRIVQALGDIVKTIWKVLEKSATWIDSNVLQPVLNYYRQLPGRIVQALGDIVDFIWGALRNSAGWIWNNVITPVWTNFIRLPSLVVSGFGDIVGTIFGGLSGAWGWIYSNVYQPIVNGFKGLPGDIASVLTGALGVFGNVGESILNSIIRGLNDVINTIDAGIGSISIFGWHPPAHIIPDIPTMATGGIVRASPGGTILRAGEGGFDEAIVPLNGRHGAGHGGDTYVTQNITITNPDPQGVVNALITYQQRKGSLSAAGIR
jgi:hypothetical protein